MQRALPNAVDRAAQQESAKFLGKAAEAEKLPIESTPQKQKRMRNR